jgi:hypothetical protein
VKGAGLCYNNIDIPYEIKGIIAKTKELPMIIKKNRRRLPIGRFLLGLLILAGGLSCKSAPPAEESAPPAEESPAPETGDPDKAPADQASLDALNAAAGRAAKARQLVIDSNGPAVFPSDWQSAEALYTQAESGKDTSTAKAVRESTARYNDAASALEALADKSIAQFARELEAEVIGIREAALKAGAETVAGEYLRSADNTALEAIAQYEAKDYYAARDSAYLARDMYGVLKTGTNAYTVRQEIIDRNFVEYDPHNIGVADEIALSGIADYEAGDIKAAQDKADEVLFRYNLALRTGKESFAADKGAVAADERQKALNLKANVAVRQDFDAATSIYNRAVNSYRGQNFDAAAALYEESRAMYEVIGLVAEEKRRIAEEALRSVEEKMTESDMAAKNAELILEGGAR